MSVYNIHPRFLEFVGQNGVHVRNLTAAADPPMGPLFFLLSYEDNFAWLD